ncbi:MAG: hypothetical protein VW985_03725 [Gammaproteobacteria bacterium]
MINLLASLPEVVASHPIEVVLTTWVIAAVGSIATAYAAKWAVSTPHRNCEGC